MSDVAALAVRNSAMAWMELHGTLKDAAGGGLISRPDLHANWLQRQEEDVLQWMEANGHPGRVIKLKGRRQGSSTGTLAQMAHRLRERPTGAFICGLDYDKNVRVMEEILWRFVDTDTFDWGGIEATRRKGSGGHFSNGSELTLYSANAGNAGRGQGAQFGLFTEAAFYPTSEGRNESDLFRALFQLIPRTVGTVIVIESTPNGEGGKYHETWLNALTFDDLKANRIPGNWNGFVKIFYPWHEFPDYRIEVTALESEEIMATLSEREMELLEAHPTTIDVGRLAWRRMVLAGPDFEGDEESFETEYPSDEHTCFAATGAKHFDWQKLKEMKDHARDGRTGVLEWSGDDRAVFRDTAEREAILRLWEDPIHGCRYSLILDPMTGEQAQGDEPDNHSPIVIRDGYYNTNSLWCPPAVVARLADCGGERMSKKRDAVVCRWDLDWLEEYITRLAVLFGNCQVVVEMNKDLGVVELAKKRGKIQLYRREVWNRREQKMTEAYGWETKEANRGAILEAIKVAVRNYVPPVKRTSGDSGGIDIWDKRIIVEMERLIRKPNGRVEAGSGWHDDTVMAVAIGWATKGKSSIYHSPAARAEFEWRKGQREAGTDFSYA